jgi:hypothetical protein
MDGSKQLYSKKLFKNECIVKPDVGGVGANFFAHGWLKPVSYNCVAKQYYRRR